MESYMFDIFSTIGIVGIYFFLIFCIGCGLMKISEWAEAVKRDKERQKRRNE